MTVNELAQLLKEIQEMKAETQNLEFKTARYGCPRKNI